MPATLPPGITEIADGCLVDYRPDFLIQQEADEVLQHARTLPYQQNKLYVRHWTDEPHLACWIADEGVILRYSGAQMTPHPECWTHQLLRIRKRVEHEAGCVYKGALVNYYRDGDDYIGWHRDKKSALGATPTISSLSVGAVRTFDLGVKVGRSVESRFTVDLQHGSLLIMGGNTNSEFYHTCQPAPFIKDARFNLTFRMVPSTSRSR